jgi:hypothetical protein
MGSGFQTSIPKPEFQNILKYNSAEPEFSFSWKDSFRKSQLFKMNFQTTWLFIKICLPLWPGDLFFSYWARILKHLLEAEKSTFWGELSFQRSECTAELTVATILCVLYFKDFSVLTVWKNDATFAFYIENIRRLIWKPWNQTFSPVVIWNSLRIRALDWMQQC